MFIGMHEHEWVKKAPTVTFHDQTSTMVSCVCGEIGYLLESVDQKLAHA